MSLLQHPLQQMPYNRSLRPGGTNAAVSDIITGVARDFGVEPVAGVLSHSMQRYQIDGEKLILNRADTDNTAADKQKTKDCVFENW